MWDRTFGGYCGSWDVDIRQTYDGGYIIASSLAGAEHTFGRNYYIIKTDSLGYSAIEDANTGSKPEALSISAYPNPFNSAVRITVGAIRESPLQIEIFDINGRMVADIPLTESESAKLSSMNASGAYR
ncbi:hypothetical protein DRQ36_08170 [bacterium]|nr:MAG: hypothetical protein DRQ36_08170 [bacterium]